MFNVAAKIIVGHRFHQYFASVTAVGYLGSSVGTMVNAPVFQVLLDVYGWKGSFLILGGLLLHLIIFGAAFTTPLVGAVETDEEDTHCIGDENTKLSACKGWTPILNKDDSDKYVKNNIFVRIAQMVTNAFDLNLFLNTDFLEMVVLFTAHKLCSLAWFVYYTANARAKGATAYQAASLYISLEVAMLSSQTLCTLLVDYCIVPVRGVLIFCFCFLSTALLCQPLINSYYAMVGGSIIFGIGFGPVRPLIYSVVKEAVVPARLAKTFAWLPCIPGIVRLCFGPIGGRCQ